MKKLLIAVAVAATGSAVFARDCKGPTFERILFLGNSLTKHGPAPEIGWTNNWGMAASAAENDYVHLFVKGVASHQANDPKWKIGSMPMEGGYAKLDPVAAVSQFDDYRPDLVVMAYGENCHSVTNDANTALYKTKYKATVEEFMRNGAVVIARAPYWPSDRHRRVLKEIANETGCVYVDIGDLGWKKGMSATGLFKHGGVAMHPGDAGMRAIADRLLDALYEGTSGEAVRRAISGRTYSVAYRPGKTLTGRLSDWDDIVDEGRLLTPMRTGVYDVPEGFGASFKCCISDRALYFLLRADDRIRAFAVSKGTCYQNDCFELYLDPLFRRSMTLDDTMSQTSITPKDAAFTDVKVVGPLPMTARKVEYSDGWAVELEIPLKNASFEMTPGDGLRFGCNVAYCNNDHPPKATVDHKFGWSRLDDTDCSWQTPGVYGTFIVRWPGGPAALPVKEGPDVRVKRERRMSGEVCEDAKLLGSFRPSPAITRGFNSGCSERDVREAKEWGANNIRCIIGRSEWVKLSPAEATAKAAESTRAALETFRRHGMKMIMDFRGFRNVGGRDASMPWRYADAYIDYIIEVLKGCEELHDLIWAVDIFNEPLDFAQLPYPPIELRAFYLKAIRAIHAIYPDLWCIYEVGPGGGYFGFTDLRPIPDPRVIYSLHFYNPGAFTHQGVEASLLEDASLTKEQKGNMKRYPGFYFGRWFDKTEIRNQLANVRKFQLRYDVPIYVGEFSCVSWAPVECTTQYLQDLVDIFEEYGWSWSYHCFRGWPGWNLDTEDGVFRNPRTGVPTRRAPIIRKALEKNAITSMATDKAEELPRIAVFGGSFSCIEPAGAAKNAWAKALNCKVDTYGIGGCGFEAGRSKGNDVSGQVKKALTGGISYKAFVLWASGNDIGYSPEATSNGVERAVKLIRERAPESKIVLLNSIDEPFRDDAIRAKLRICAEAQNGICAKLGVPVLDLHGHSGITRENGRELVSVDNCHMTEAGYMRIAPMTTEFLLKEIRGNRCPEK